MCVPRGRGRSGRIAARHIIYDLDLAKGIL